MTSVHRNYSEPRWHAGLAIVLALALYVTLPPKFTFGPLWLFPLVILALLVPLAIFSPNRANETTLQRVTSIAIIALVNLTNLLSVVILIGSLLFRHKKETTGADLLLAGVQIWATNVLVFALWYWELDSGGPEQRAHAKNAADFPDPDFQFTQMAGGERPPCVSTGWKPLFVDYLYLAFNTATALSPADTMPLSPWAKMLMMAESVISLATIAVIIGRAINILQ